MHVVLRGIFNVHLTSDRIIGADNTLEYFTNTTEEVPFPVVKNNYILSNTIDSK